MVIHGDFQQKQRLDAFERRFGPRRPIKNEGSGFTWRDYLGMALMVISLIAVIYKLWSLMLPTGPKVYHIPTIHYIERSKTDQRI